MVLEIICHYLLSYQMLKFGIKLHGAARPYREALLKEGLLCKETQDNVIRFAPPLVISKEDLDWAISKIKKVLSV